MAILCWVLAILCILLSGLLVHDWRWWCGWIDRYDRQRQRIADLEDAIVEERNHESFDKSEIGNCLVRIDDDVSAALTEMADFQETIADMLAAVERAKAVLLGKPQETKKDSIHE